MVFAVVSKLLSLFPCLLCWCLLLHWPEFSQGSMKFYDTTSDLMWGMKDSSALTDLSFSGVFQPECWSERPWRCGGEGRNPAAPTGSSLHHAQSGWTDHGCLQPEWHRSVCSLTIQSLTPFLLCYIISFNIMTFENHAWRVARGLKLKYIWQSMGAMW